MEPVDVEATKHLPTQGEGSDEAPDHSTDGVTLAKPGEPGKVVVEEVQPNTIDESATS